MSIVFMVVGVLFLLVAIADYDGMERQFGLLIGVSFVVLGTTMLWAA